MILIRKANNSDSPRILEWRNDPVTQKMSKNTSPVRPEDHEAWFMTMRNDPSRIIYIAEVDAKPVAMCRFDLISIEEIPPRNGLAEVSINLAPEIRGRGLSSEILSRAIERFFSDYRPLSLIADIKEDNSASIRCFLKAGFVDTRKRMGEYLRFSRESNRLF